MNPGSRLFPTTAWSVIRALRDPAAPAFTRSLDRLIQLYWKPVFWLLRTAYSKNDDDARDLTQEFFTSVVVEGRMVVRYDAEKGSFRAFLKGALARFLSKMARNAGRLKRGGEVSVISLDGDAGELREVLAQAGRLGPEEAFDQAWRHLVVERAVAQLALRLQAQGRATAFEIFRRHDLVDEEPPPSYALIGRALGLSSDQVKHQLAHARATLRTIAVELITEYVAGPEDLERELAELLGHRGE